MSHKSWSTQQRFLGFLVAIPTPGSSGKTGKGSRSVSWRGNRDYLGINPGLDPKFLDFTAGFSTQTLPEFKIPAPPCSQQLQEPKSARFSMEMDLKFHFYGSRGIQISKKCPKNPFSSLNSQKKGGPQPLFQLGWLQPYPGAGKPGSAPRICGNSNNSFPKKGRIWVRSVPRSAGNPQGFRERLITAGKKGKNSV